MSTEKDPEENSPKLTPEEYDYEFSLIVDNLLSENPYFVTDAITKEKGKCRSLMNQTSSQLRRIERDFENYEGIRLFNFTQNNTRYYVLIETGEFEVPANGKPESVKGTAVLVNSFRLSDSHDDTPIDSMIIDMFSAFIPEKALKSRSNAIGITPRVATYHDRSKKHTEPIPRGGTYMLIDNFDSIKLYGYYKGKRTETHKPKTPKLTMPTNMDNLAAHTGLYYSLTPLLKLCDEATLVNGIKKIH